MDLLASPEAAGNTKMLQSTEHHESLLQLAEGTNTEGAAGRADGRLPACDTTCFTDAHHRHLCTPVLGTGLTAQPTNHLPIRAFDGARVTDTVTSKLSAPFCPAGFRRDSAISKCHPETRGRARTGELTQRRHHSGLTPSTWLSFRCKGMNVHCCRPRALDVLIKATKPREAKAGRTRGPKQETHPA